MLVNLKPAQFSLMSSLQMPKPKTQQEIWQQEHETQSDLPSMANKKPTEGVIDLVKYFGKDWFKDKKIIDIGCGKGRNCVYLAQQEAQLWAIDYIKDALSVAKDLASESKVDQQVSLVCSRIDETWPFESDFFDVAVDSFASIDVETLVGREKYRNEMFRTLKPNGYALVLVVSKMTTNSRVS